MAIGASHAGDNQGRQNGPPNIHVMFGISSIFKGIYLAHPNNLLSSNHGYSAAAQLKTKPDDTNK